MVLAVFGIMAATLVVTMLPIPVWISRATRKPSPHKALPAADRSLVAPEAGVLMTEINTALDLVGRAREHMADYVAAAPMTVVLRDGSANNWVNNLIHASQYAEQEASQAVARVIEAIGDVPDEVLGDRDTLSQSLGTYFSDLGAVHGEAPGQRLSRAQAQAELRRYDSTIKRLIRLRRTLVEGRDPYRG